MSQTSESKKYNPFEELGAEIESLPHLRKSPEPRREPEDEITRQDAAGRDIPIKRERGSKRTVHNFSMRVTVRSSNKFAAWCDKHRLSYREGFDLLVPFLDQIKI